MFIVRPERVENHNLFAVKSSSLYWIQEFKMNCKKC
jgi:hypothetical protein